MWGQGIPDGSKFRDAVTRWLQAALQGKYVVQQFQTRAHSGAHVYMDPSSDYVTNWNGEIPSPQPSIPLQINMTLQDLAVAKIPATQVRVVLVDGCINDVGILSILDPVNSSGNIRNWADQWCLAPMQGVLQTIALSFPYSVIVVAGYFKAITDQTDTGALAVLMGALGWTAGPWGALASTVGGVIGKDQVVANWAALADESMGDLAQDVALINQNAPPNFPRVALADPGFADSQAYAATYRGLFMVREFGGDEDDGLLSQIPRQPVATLQDVAFNRAIACKQIGDPNPIDFAECVDASMAHPNPAGVDQYTAAVTGALQNQLAATLGLPPPPPPPPYLLVGVRTGSDNLGPTIKINPNSPPTKLTNWVIVTAFNNQTRAPVSGSVKVANTPARPGTFVPSEGSGQTGAKIYHWCAPKYAVNTLPNSVLRGTQITYPCEVTVSAPGWMPAAKGLN
jgi:hypothetical protein